MGHQRHPAPAEDRDVGPSPAPWQLHRRRCTDADQQSLEVALRQLALTEEHLQRFLAAGKPTEERAIRRQALRFFDEAKKQVMTEVKK